MFIELHLLQNFAPACLNRDDTNSPKDCEFGGVRRARISSQCIKRAVRTHFKSQELFPKEQLALRTLRLLDEATDRLVAEGKDREQARRVAEKAIRGWGLGLKDSGKTQYLLFIGGSAVSALVQACLNHWDMLAQVEDGEGEEVGKEATEKSKKAAKKADKAAAPEELKKVLGGIWEGDKAVDLALFGRMLADLPDRNIDAACQVAHAISTNKVSMEFDFFTAVDDLSPKEETGAGMMGTVEFNSACFYRYANIDLKQLAKNLGNDTELAEKAVEAFLRASVAAIPTGKQNSMAAQNPPSLVFAVVREQGLWSLANAFVNPVRPGNDGLVQKSITALEDYWGKLAAAYGEEEIKTKAILAVEGELGKLKEDQAGNLTELMAKVRAGIKREPGGEG